MHWETLIRNDYASLLDNKDLAEFVALLKGINSTLTPAQYKYQ